MVFIYSWVLTKQSRVTQRAQVSKAMQRTLIAVFSPIAIFGVISLVGGAVEWLGRLGRRVSDWGG